jgi:hypothetical protein
VTNLGKCVDSSAIFVFAVIGYRNRAAAQRLTGRVVRLPRPVQVFPTISEWRMIASLARKSPEVTFLITVHHSSVSASSSVDAASYFSVTSHERLT